MILAEDLKWLTDRWLSLVNEIVNALLAGHQFRSLPNRPILSFGIMLSRAGRSGVATDEGGHPRQRDCAAAGWWCRARPPVVPAPPVLLAKGAGAGLPDWSWADGRASGRPLCWPADGPRAGPLAPAGPRTAAQAWRPHSP
jgi:hypothetical protein